jgi:hypothetical protein
MKLKRFYNKTESTINEFMAGVIVRHVSVIGDYEMGDIVFVFYDELPSVTDTAIDLISRSNETGTVTEHDVRRMHEAGQ